MSKKVKSKEVKSKEVKVEVIPKSKLFTATMNLKHNGVAYKPGSVVKDLNDKQAGRLLDLKAIEAS